MLDTINLQEQKERGDAIIRKTQRRFRMMWGLVILLVLAGFFLPSMLQLNLDSMGYLGFSCRLFSLTFPFFILGDKMAKMFKHG
jgi:hypothetical protein